MFVFESAMNTFIAIILYDIHDNNILKLTITRVARHNI